MPISIGTRDAELGILSLLVLVLLSFDGREAELLANLVRLVTGLDPAHYVALRSRPLRALITLMIVIYLPAFSKELDPSRVLPAVKLLALGL